MLDPRTRELEMMDVGCGIVQDSSTINSLHEYRLNMAEIRKPQAMNLVVYCPHIFDHRKADRMRDMVFG